MCPAKKENDISKDKIKIARAGFKSYMAAGGGGMEAELLKGVMEDAKKKEEEGKEERVAIKADEAKAKETEEREGLVEEIEEERIEHEMKDIKGTIPSSTKLMIATILAIGYDIVNLITGIIALFTVGVSFGGDFVGDMILQFVVFPALLGPHFEMPTKKKILEWIPVIDIIYPGYTLAILKTRKALKGARGDLEELGKEKKKLKGESKKRGFLGFTGRTWAIILTFFITISFLLFFIVGPFSLIVSIGAFLAFIFIDMLRDEETRGIAVTILIIALIIGGIGGAVIFVVIPVLGLADYGGPLGESAATLAALPTNIKLWLTEHNPVTAVKNYYKKQMLAATGDYYTGKVDENAQAKLGVYLEDIKQADPVFYTDRPVGMFATLKVHTLDKPVNVTIVCENKNAEEGVTPQIYPRERFDVDTYEETDIDCMFPAHGIKKGSSIFMLGADFNFKTMSYVKSYFMDGERLRSMRREEIDPLDQYGITEKNPIAVYTVGPVSIGMGVGKPPVGIDLDQAYTPMTLGITIENKWDGKIMKINRFIVILPKGFTLEEIGAPKVQISCDELAPEEEGLCSDELHTVYKITDPTFGKVERGNFKSYRGFLRVNQGDYENVLGKITPVSTKYFKAMVDYTYRLEKRKTIIVKARERLGLPFADVAGAGVDMTPPTLARKTFFDTIAGVVTGVEREVFEAEKITNNSVRITWETNEDSNDIFEWWDPARPPPIYPPLTTPNEVGFTKEHVRVFEGVSLNKEYACRITSTDGNGNSATITKTFKIT